MTPGKRKRSTPDKRRSQPDGAGQSGDMQGLPETPEADSQSVKELVEEGQYFEAEVVDAIENAPDPDQSKVKTREAKQDDVPPEYEGDEQKN